MDKALSNAEDVAGKVVIPLLRKLVGEEDEEEGGRREGGREVPGQVLERLMVLYLRSKGTKVTDDVVKMHCSKANWDLGEDLEDLEEEEEERGGGREEGRMVRGAVLAVLLEKVVALGPGVWGTGTQIITCCGLVLFLASSSSSTSSSFNKVCEEEKRGAVDKGEEGVEEGLEELLSVVLSLLSVLLEMGEEQRGEKEEKALRDLLPLLSRIVAPEDEEEEEEGGEKGGQIRKRRRFQPAVTEMASTIQAMIWTRALSVQERQEQREREERAVHARGGMGLEDILKAVEMDVHSPMVPLRARGLVTLTKVLHSLPRQQQQQQQQQPPPLTKRLVVVVSESGEEVEKGTECSSRSPVEQALDLLLLLLCDKDSFVYLAAVQGLSVLSDKAPSLVIDRLLIEMNAEEGREEGEKGGVLTPTEVWQYRLKIAEALVQALQRCGEAMPVYAPKAVPAFIRGSRPPSLPPSSTSSAPAAAPITSSQEEEEEEEEEEDIEKAGSVEEEGHYRASCLSGLADVCELLGWSIQRYRTDVLDLALAILTREREEGSNGESSSSSSRRRRKKKTKEKGEGEKGKEESLLAVARRQAQTLVRRAAVFLLERLLRGLGSQRLLPVVGVSALQKIMEVLARTEGCGEGDEVTRVHARRAREEVELALVQPVYDSCDPRGRVSALQALTTRLEGGREGGMGGMLREMMREVEEEGRGERGGT
eukprot:evm.model.NODE_886_length_11563_cov_32.173485.1